MNEKIFEDVRRLPKQLQVRFHQRVAVELSKLGASEQGVSLRHFEHCLEKATRQAAETVGLKPAA